MHSWIFNMFFFPWIDQFATKVFWYTLWPLILLSTESILALEIKVNRAGWTHLWGALIAMCTCKQRTQPEVHSIKCTHAVIETNNHRNKRTITINRNDHKHNTKLTATHTESYLLCLKQNLKPSTFFQSQIISVKVSKGI